MPSPLIESLRRAVEATPEDVHLRLHLAELLLAAGDAGGAIVEAAESLRREPHNDDARRLMARLTTDTSGGGTVRPSPDPTEPDVRPSAGAPEPAVTAEEPPTGFDWTAAEDQVADVVPPMFVQGTDSTPDPDLRPSEVTLADVGGLAAVKERIEAAFLSPLRNPELRALYGKSLRGGLLLYGPPGCGKTFIARAVAGELGAGFLSVGVADILDPLLGMSERNMRDAFRKARAHAPCVLFFDELDALGRQRAGSRNDSLRGTVNQLLTELDGFDNADDGVFVLGATNQPWDVDPALRRPGRFDRTMLVEPPDRAAREAIFGSELRQRPVANIDLGMLANRSEGLSGADIAHVCQAAMERALIDSARSGAVRLATMADLDAALNEVRPSIGPWLEAARNVVTFADQDGAWSDLRDYLKRTRRL